MFRRCVALLVTAGFLAGQTAAIPHAHGSASQDPDHGARAHCHLEWFGHWEWFGHGEHEQGHGHSHHSQDSHRSQHSHHSHGHPGHSHHSPSEPKSQPPECTAVHTDPIHTDHDADAVYLPDCVGARATTLSASAATAPCPWVLAPPFALFDVAANAARRVAGYCHPPDEVLDASDSYLILRNLRI